MKWDRFEEVEYSLSQINHIAIFSPVNANQSDFKRSIKRVWKCNFKENARARVEEDEEEQQVIWCWQLFYNLRSVCDTWQLIGWWWCQFFNKRFLIIVLLWMLHNILANTGCMKLKKIHWMYKIFKKIKSHHVIKIILIKCVKINN